MARMRHSRWASELAGSLVGEPVDLRGVEPDARAVLAAMHEAGWPAELVVAIAYDRIANEEPWPFPVDRSVISAGPAQWYATLGEARRLLGLDGEVRPPSTRTALSADERRLLTDVPPHW